MKYRDLIRQIEPGSWRRATLIGRRTRFVFLVWWAMVLGRPVISQSSHLTGEDIFLKYPVTDVFRGKPASLDLSSGDARLYRTQLRYAMRKGPKFAGYYAVASWGCGTGCSMAAIVDLRTGKATFFPATIEEWFDRGDIQSAELTYKLRSRAWHVVGDLNEKNDPADRWFVWTGERFELISRSPVMHASQ